MFYRSYDINISPIKEVTQLSVTKHQTSKQPLQKCIHGSPGNWSRTPWDSRSPLWEPLLYIMSLRHSSVYTNI